MKLRFVRARKIQTQIIIVDIFPTFVDVSIISLMMSIFLPSYIISHRKEKKEEKKKMHCLIENYFFADDGAKA